MPAELPHLLFSGAPFASPSLIAPAFFRQDFAQDLSPKLAATLSAQQRPTDSRSSLRHRVLLPGTLSAPNQSALVT